MFKKIRNFFRIKKYTKTFTTKNSVQPECLVNETKSSLENLEITEEMKREKEKRIEGIRLDLEKARDKIIAETDLETNCRFKAYQEKLKLIKERKKNGEK